MILLIFLLSASVTNINGAVTEACPTCILVDGSCYNVSHLFDLKAPFRNEIVIHKLGLLRSKNILFFSFEPEILDPEYYKTGFVNLDTKEFGVINLSNQILNFGTFDIDQERNMIYFAGSDGIFVLDKNNDNMASYSSRGDFISNIFYRNNVYFTKFNDEGVIVKKGDYFKTLVENISVKKFIVNKMGVMVYMNNTGLFLSKGDTVAKVSSNPFFRGIANDLDENVYVWWIDGLYKINIEKELHKSYLVKVADLPGIGAVAFDNQNNMLFTHEEGLYKVVPTTEGCFL